MDPFEVPIIKAEYAKNCCGGHFPTEHSGVTDYYIGTLILAHYRSETHFKHNILSLRSLTSFQSDKNYRTGGNQA